MKIGIDVDGCLADFNRSYRTLVLDLTGILLPAIDDTYPNCWNYDLAAGVTREQASNCWRHIKDSTSFWRHMGALPDARLALKILADASWASDVYFVTSRPGNSSKQQTEDWLRAHGYYTSPTVLIANGNKGLLSSGLGLEVFVDDKLENCEDVLVTSPACQVFLVDAPWNRSREVAGAKRVKSVVEALSIVFARQERAAA
jgi:5'(3')-deoxyribonucleotidase